MLYVVIISFILAIFFTVLSENMRKLKKEISNQNIMIKDIYNVFENEIKSLRRQLLDRDTTRQIEMRKIPSNRKPRTEEQKKVASEMRKKWWDEKKRREKLLILPDVIEIMPRETPRV